MYVFAVLLLSLYLQATPPVPEQTKKPDGSHHNAQTQPSPTTVDLAPAARPSPPAEQNRTDGKTNQSTWRERVMKPLLDNWPLVVVAIWGIIVARSTLKSIDKQAASMAGSVHVDGVRVIELIEGRTPIFFVTVANSGMTARRVSMTIEINILGDVTKYHNSVSMMIPAQRERDFFIHSGIIVNSTLLQKVSGDTLRVRGRITWGKGKKNTEEYCYKYNPCPFAERPKEFPQFVPCDFNMGRDVGVSIRMQGVATAIGTLTAKVESPEDKSKG